MTSLFNDMVVDSQGRAYIGCYGYSLQTYQPGAPASIIMVTPDGDISIVTDEMERPNGMVITPDGITLIAADTVALRLVAFGTYADGSLTGRRVWAQLEEAPDGICLDAEGAIWVASPNISKVFRVRKGGGVTDWIEAFLNTYACMLGGPKGWTLFIMTAQPFNCEEIEGKRNACIEVVEVAVPGADLP